MAIVPSQKRQAISGERSSLMRILERYLPFLAAPVPKKKVTALPAVHALAAKRKRHRHRHKKHRSMKHPAKNQQKLARQTVPATENGSRKKEIEEVEDATEFDGPENPPASSDSSESSASSDSSDDDEPLFLPAKTQPESHGMWKKGESPARSALAVGSAETLVTGDFLDRSANRKDRGLRGWFASLPSMFARRP